MGTVEAEHHQKRTKPASRSADSIEGNRSLPHEGALGGLGAGICVIGSNGTIINCNQVAQDILGVDITGALIDATPLAELKQSAPASSHYTFSIVSRELLIQRPNSPPQIIAVTAQPIQISSHFEGTVIVLSDITKAKKRESSLQRTQEELERSNTELEDFAYIVSHDLQEPLRMVASYTELLSKRYKEKLDERAQKYIHHAVSGSRRMQAMIRDLLLLSRVQSSDQPLVPTDLSRAVQTALRQLGRLIRESQAQIVADELPTLPADHSQMAQVFQNLIGNAIKYAGGTQPAIHIRSRQDDKAWIISVHDNGVGIEPKYHKKIFDIFQRVPSTDKNNGTGIGLSLVKRVLRRHQADIRVESQLGEGASFYMTFPKEAHKETEIA